MNKILFGGNVYQEITDLDTFVNVNTDVWTWKHGVKNNTIHPARPVMTDTTWKYQFTRLDGTLDLNNKAYRLIGKTIRKIV
jgi:hypothetical protein